MFRNPNLVPSSRGKLGKPLFSSDFTFRLKNEKKTSFVLCMTNSGNMRGLFFFWLRTQKSDGLL
jgi:hypothetical protein